MNRLLDTATSSIEQVIAVLIVSVLAYGLHRLFLKDKNKLGSFFDYIGLRRVHGQFDKTYWIVLSAIILFAVVSTYLQFHFSESFRGFLTGDTSPYGKILKDGFNPLSIASGAIYCFVQAAGSEEILFRGLIGRRLFNKFGHAFGNLVQAFLFWIMHLFIFRLVTGDWISWIQVYAFAVSFGLGLLLGFVNFRKDGESIAPSWLLHGCANFATFLALGFLIKF